MGSWKLKLKVVGFRNVLSFILQAEIYTGFQVKHLRPWEVPENLDIEEDSEYLKGHKCQGTIKVS